MIAYIPILVALIGLLLYALSSRNPKVAELGRIAFFCGLLAVCFAFAKQTMSLWHS